jgi:hypothetical protein
MKTILNSISVIIVSLVSLYSQPVIQWEKEYNGTANSIDKIIAIRSEPYSNNIYVCGYVTNIGSGMDIITIKYNSAGMVVWSAIYNGTGNSTDYPVDMDVSSNWVTICGSSIGATGNYDIIYQVYGNVSGAASFSGRYNGAANLNDFATSIKVDIGGTRFVSGITTNLSGNTDLILLNYGGFFSQVTYNGPANRNETGGFMKFKNGVSGNFILTGTTEISTAEKQIYIAEYNSSGLVVWSKSETVINGINEVSGFEIGPSSNILVYGTLPIALSLSGIFVKQFTTSGISGLTYIHGHQSTLNDKAVSMKVDNSGNIYVTGYTLRGGSNDYVTFKLNSGLVLQWNNYYDGPAAGNDIPGSISIDNSGNAIITGTSAGNGTGNDIATIWYDANGTERWQQRYNGSPNNDDEGTGALLLTSGQFAVSGFSTGSGTGADMKLIKYSDAALPVNMVDFSGNSNQRNVYLSWQTSEEINNSGFDIERRSLLNGISSNWERIAFISGNGTTNQPSRYTYKDNNLNTGKYNYRLKQIDYNGNYEYFELNTPREIVIGVPKENDLSQNYPNPSNPTSIINYSVSKDGFVKLKIYDMLGRVCAVLIDEFKTAGYHTARFDGSLLSSGIYFYRLETESFAETKKMILIK